MLSKQIPFQVFRKIRVTNVISQETHSGWHVGIPRGLTVHYTSSLTKLRQIRRTTTLCGRILSRFAYAAEHATTLEGISSRHVVWLYLYQSSTPCMRNLALAQEFQDRRLVQNDHDPVAEAYDTRMITCPTNAMNMTIIHCLRVTIVPRIFNMPPHNRNYL